MLSPLSVALIPLFFILGQGPVERAVPEVPAPCEPTPPSCPAGRGGPACDLVCAHGSCTVVPLCQSDGTFAGLSAVDSHVFRFASPGATITAENLARALREFIVAHPADFGLAPGLDADELDVLPTADPQGSAGLLTLFRFQQRYRGLPIFGPGAGLTLAADPEGVRAIRGMPVDPRITYAHLSTPAPPEVAVSSIRAHVHHLTGIPQDALEVAPPILVAMPQAQSLGWMAPVAHGLAHVAAVVIAADDDPAVLPRLLYFNEDRADGLEDEVPLTVRSDDLAAGLFLQAPTPTLISSLVDGSPLLGSTVGAAIRLANPRLVALDAAGVQNLNVPLEPPTAPTAEFLATPGDPLFDAQRAFHLVGELYAFTDRWMHGRWESAMPLRGRPSLFAPGEFYPRALVFTRAASGCAGASACMIIAPVREDFGEDPYRHPDIIDHPNAPPYESLGFLLLRDPRTGFATIAHEFGHLVDAFAAPGFFSTGLGCYGSDTCEPSCSLDTTDEAPALNETWANLAALWYARSLTAQGADPEDCAALPAISRGTNRAPHSPTCRPDGQPIRRFRPADDPTCTPGTCDRPTTPGKHQDHHGVWRPTGLCSTSPGYQTNSVYQAFWELLHAQHCAPTPPFPCAELPHLAALGPDALGEAMLYAVRLSGGSYRTFFDDLVTAIACNHGAAAYDEVQGVLCHHDLRPCDAPAPLTCETCGNGVREGSEACDGDDLAGATCEDLGLAAGQVACTPTCTLDTSGCSPPPEPEEEPEEEPEPEPMNDLDESATTGGPTSAEDGCGCRATPPAPLVPALLGLLALSIRGRRRRRPRLTGLGLLALTATLGACQDPPPGATTTTTTTAATDTDTDTEQSTAPAEPDPRFFRTFHSESVYVGYSNESEPDEFFIIDPYAIITIEDDGVMHFEYYWCGDTLVRSRDYPWAYLQETSALEIIPDEHGLIEGVWDSALTALNLTLDTACDGVVMTMTDTEDREIIRYFRPGRVCAEVSDPEKCRFSILWCDEGEPPPPCPEAP